MVAANGQAKGSRIATNTSRRIGPRCLQGLLLAVCGMPLLAAASEGGLGRPITGLQITPYAGLIPPTPGMQWTVGYVHYDGSIGASRQVPVAGQVSLGLDVQLELFTATGVYIWPTGEGRWNYASMLTVPYIDVGIDATLAGDPGQLRRRQHAGNLFDLYFAPVIASYHIDQTHHLSMGLYVYAPTAEYDASRLANPGLNVWTVSPTLGYTQLMSNGTLEFSLQGALDWYSRNDDTDYKNGVVWRSEALLVKRYAGGWGVGAAAGWIQQLERDDGALADRLDGFKGRAFGVGPVLTYSKAWEGGQHVDVAFRYLGEFSVKNRFDGDPLSLSIGFAF